MEPGRLSFQFILTEYDLTFPIVSLILANLATIIFAIAGNWDAGTVLFIYWTQSISIGIVTVVSILTIDPARVGENTGNQSHQEGGTRTINPLFVWIGKMIMAGLFTIHYGIFHLVYVIFIVSGLFGTIGLFDPAVWFSCLVFFANHLFSFLYYKHRNGNDRTYFQESISAAYQRILPMHLALVFGVILILGLHEFGIQSTLPALVILLLAKTAIDISMHMRKHAAHEHQCV